jgi:heme exporter protein C
MTNDTTPRQRWWQRIAHPGQFVAWTTPLLWPLSIVTVVLFGFGLWFAFFNSPEDYQMGNTVRIMYIHVPNAWLSQFVYAVMTVSALGTLVWRHPMADVSMKAAAPLGALFTAMGPPHLGHVLGMGWPHDLYPGPAVHLSGHYRTVAGF